MRIPLAMRIADDLKRSSGDLEGSGLPTHPDVSARISSMEEVCLSQVANRRAAIPGYAATVRHCCSKRFSGAARSRKINRFHADSQWLRKARSDAPYCDDALRWGVHPRASRACRYAPRYNAASSDARLVTASRPRPHTAARTVPSCVGRSKS